MAEDKKEKKEKIEQPKVDEKKPSTKVRPEGISPGRIVHFLRDVNTGMGTKVEVWPAIILAEAAKESNFKAEDGAVDLKVFTKHGDEVRNGVMFAHEGVQGGRWMFPPKV